MVVVHTFSPSTWEAEAGDLCEFEVSLVYGVNSRAGSKATEKPCLEKKKLSQAWWLRSVIPTLHFRNRGRGLH